MQIKDIVPSEDYEQTKVSCWLHKRGIRHTASANGAKRSYVTGKKLKAMGMSAGFPDLTIPYVRKPYAGLYIEMKRTKGGKLSSYQIEWLQFLRDQGYYADCARGFDEAIVIITSYFSLDNNKK